MFKTLMVAFDEERRTFKARTREHELLMQVYFIGDIIYNL